jgi:NAD-dependent deacetylase
MNERDFESAAQALSRAGKVSAFSGSGVSAESGVPTFRSAGGLWEDHRVEDVATPEALRRNPRLVWEFYEMRRKNMTSVAPNPGHIAIAEMEELFEEFTTITQNIDGLHQRAGSTRVHEVHGSLWKAHCLEECGRIEDPFPYPAGEVPPRCQCGSILRPSVVLFGEMLPEDTMAAAVAAAVRSEVALVVGTSSVVWPAAGIPLMAQEAGATVIEVNPERTELTDRFDISLRGRSGEIIPRLLERVRELRR